MADRYYCNQPIQGDLATLEGQEAQHLGKVMRANPGDRVVLFDNSGDQFEAEVKEVRRQQVLLTVLSRDSVCRELPEPVTLYTALPKGDRQRWLIEKTVESGVSRFVPIITTRSVVKPNPKTIERLERTVIEASKQCGRNRLMQITPPQTWPNVLAEAQDITRLIAHPTNSQQLPPTPKAPLAIAIGPEGGFTDDEVQQALDAGWQPVSLGPRILRIETAALALIARVTL